jgi:hypothetical protein
MNGKLLIAFKIIERFLAIVTLEQRFAGGRSKFTDPAGVVRIAMRTGNRFVFSK